VGFSNADATGYYRVGYQPDTVRGLARDAERQAFSRRTHRLVDRHLGVGTCGARTGWRLSRFDKVSAATAIAQLLKISWRGWTTLGGYLVTDSDRESYRLWLREYLTPILKDVGWEAKPGESDEQKMLRADVFTALGYNARIRKRWRGLVSSQARLWKIPHRSIVNWRTAPFTWRR